MLQISGAKFTEPSPTQNVEEQALIIHRRSDSARGTHLAIFVHGLGGLRYGPNATWGDFPEMVFEDFPKVDIGMYAYRTLFRRLKFWKSVSLDKEAAVLGDLLLTLNDYDYLIFLGHSLGGVLCKSVLAYLFETGRQEALGKISSLLLMATPQLGSSRIPNIFSSLSYDSQALKQNGPYLEKLTNLFQNHFHCARSYPLDDRVHVPCWAIIASEDFWVDGLSAGISLDESQKRTVRGTHTSIVKPRSKTDDAYSHAHFFLEQSLNHRKSQTKAQCSPASEDDLVLIHELAVSLFGSEVSSLGLMRSWWNRNRNSFWLLRRVIRGPGRRIEEAVGYFCLLPISIDTAGKLKNGELKGSTLPPEVLLTASDDLEALYIGGIAGIDFRAKAEVMLALTTHLYSLDRKGKRLPVLTRPVTSDGLRVVEQYEMDPVDHSKNGIGSLYQFSL